VTDERTIRSEAIILSRTDFGEADRLLVLLTPRHGKLRAIAKGARKPTTRKSGHVELYARTDMLLHRGRDLMIISQAEMTEGYMPLREDLNRMAYASYVAELVDRFTSADDDSDSETIFALLDASLRALCGDSDLRIVARFFEMRLLDTVGFRPDLAHCAICGEEIRAEAQYFSTAEGGAVCRTCGAQRSSVTPISLPALHALRVMQREPWARVRGLGLSDLLHAELERIMLGYLIALLESRVQSADFIRRLRSGV
jgi:DNA repair protein RecO (recombination protein O)